MEPEKIYYAVVVLVCAASMLLSPFFYVRRTRAVTPVRRRRQIPPLRRRWRGRALAQRHLRLTAC